MSFDPKKLYVNLITPATHTKPVIGRKYTLTHSDETGELFLDVGYRYNDQAINWKMRDEVIAEWSINPTNQISLVEYAYVDSGEYSKEEATYRFQIFQKEMATALKGIMNGDRTFIYMYPSLLYKPIYIFYHSIYPEYNQIFYYGQPIDYLSGA
ncbi:staygreen family protein [Aquibacillus sediminis]|uniref:staygreen family protein n=1 Tax=Aquibacillus sediminis TaxID=2574734 RepID=UPI001107DEAE|nr:staygreen family protein [Aquibacillus sediminis]